MVAQQKTEDPLQEQINERPSSSTSENTPADGADAADDLITALDNLLLERALEQHRVALARLNELKLALAQAVSKALVDQDALPLGTWLWDEVVLAVISRYADQLPRAGEFLHTTSRNLSRWLPGIEQRQAQRNLSSYWRESQRLVAPWVRELPVSEEPLKETVLNMLMFQLEHQGKQAVLPLRAHILGVSAPTYQKRLKDYTQRLAAEPDSMDGTL